MSIIAILQEKYNFPLPEEVHFAFIKYNYPIVIDKKKACFEKNVCNCVFFIA